ncbi:uncharacterized protein LOC123272557 [Cotesia glomerata]|uniref:uncharacterized protein LOC123272557 n=1 Tax=Cotesia glomerata TaxID=32391 RepID=UPI001D012A1B|nr:uncharacterized protein LOC123272557 [Cotesia glomerata]
MKRGPYNSHFAYGGDAVIPKSTFYDKLAKCRRDVTRLDCGALLPDDNENMNAVDQLDNTEMSSNSNLSQMEAIDDIILPPTCQDSSIEISTESVSWIQEEYDEETLDREIWFEAEDSPPSNDDYTGYMNEPYQYYEKRNDTDENNDKTLCDCTTITRGEALMMTLLLGAEESLTWKAITAILSLINTLFQNNVVPASKYKLFQTLKLNEDITIYHLYCDECFHYFGAKNKLDKEELVCQICRNNGNSSDVAYFLTLDVSLQLQSILENSEVQSSLMKRFYGTEDNRTRNNLQSMSDGQLYKKLSINNNSSFNKYDFTYTFNTDGCQPSKSSKLSIWPIFVCINELPLKLQSKHMIMAGLWVNKKEPDMLLFLQPFVDQANKLSDEGVKWKLGDELITSKFFPLCAVTDSVARCKILNMKQYNGTYGCTFCEHPTERIDNNQKYTISTNVPRARTDESIKAHMIQAGEHEYGKSVIGVWGPSPLMNLKHFNLVDGMSPDYMHSILLGVIKQHTDILVTSFGAEYYVGSPNQLEAINTKLGSFKHPSCITRSPRQLSEREMWKATEWRSWLLFYSLICLKGILPQKYLEHLALLVEAVRILLCSKIHHVDLQTAETLIVKYVVLYQEYFGKAKMTYNVHLLLHMALSVLNLGPLKYHNTFIFENENHFLLKLRKSPKNVGIQISRRYLFQKALLPLKNKIKTSEDFIKFCEKNLSGRLKNSFNVDGCILIGKGKKYVLNTREREILNITAECKSFNRFIHDNIRYTSKTYRLCEKIDDSVVLLKNGTVGIIQNVCYFETSDIEKKIYIFYEEVVLKDKYYYSSANVTTHHIKECSITEKLNCCEIEMILKPCMLTTIENKHFVIIIPEGCYGD